MTIRTIVALCASLMVLTAPAAGQDASSITAAELAAFDAYVTQAVKDWNLAGLAIALVHEDSTIFARGYGVIEVGKPAPVTEHTRFAVGSTTKAMTTAALALLVDEGKLSWDDRVIDHLPQLRLHDPYATRELTVRDLLTHRTGLPGTDLFWTRLDYDLDEMLYRLRFVEPVSSFRTTWNYQNVVYAIAGALIEELSGMPWHDFVRTRIFAPLGMHESEPLDAGILEKPNVAVPHDATNDSLYTVPKRTTDAVASVGSVWSSVSDMAKWMRFMLDSARVDGRPLIQPATFREIVAPEIRAPLAIYGSLALVKPTLLTYALGWFVHDFDGDIVWMHTGSINGMSAIVGLLPNRRFGVVVLINRDHAEVRHALMYRAFDLAGGNPMRDWSRDVLALQESAQRPTASAPRAATPPSLPLERYAGTYSHGAYGRLLVSHRGGQLRAQFESRPAYALVHTDFETFRTSDAPSGDGFTVTFDPDGSGRIVAARLFGASFERLREASDR
jgi:CubicO group peptidase (beta-lactamase class C family)